MSHLCKKLIVAITYLIENNLFVNENLNWRRKLVIAGGVASNKYLMRCITIAMEPYGFETLAPKSELCTDNAEMVAWLGIENILSKFFFNFLIFNSVFLRSQSVINYEKLPDVLRVEAVSPTGLNFRKKLPRRMKQNFSPKQIHLKACSSS